MFASFLDSRFDPNLFLLHFGPLDLVLQKITCTVEETNPSWHCTILWSRCIWSMIRWTYHKGERCYQRKECPKPKMQLFRSRPFVEFTASRQVNTEIDRKEGGSALEPLPDLDFGKKDSLISLFQNDLIKSEGLKTEIWSYFMLFRWGAKYSL